MPDTDIPSRPLRVFLCHSSADKAAVRELYRRLRADGFESWLDEENLLPGQDWENQIPKAVRTSDVVIVCLSRGSINKAGYVQKEIRFALDIAEEQPDDVIFIIPLKLEECKVPDRIRRWQWVNYFDSNGYERLVRSLRLRAESLETTVALLESEPREALKPSGSIVNQQSGGINVEADQVSVGQDVIGRDKVVSAGGHIIHAETGATVIINEQLTSTTEQPANEKAKQGKQSVIENSTSNIAFTNRLQTLLHKYWLRGGLIAFLIVAVLLAIAGGIINGNNATGISATQTAVALALLPTTESTPADFGDDTLPLRPTVIPPPSDSLITVEPPPARLPDASTPVASVPVRKPTPIDSTAHTPTRIVIPTIKLDAPVEVVGWSTVDGVSQWDVPDHFAAGWLMTSAPLGESGNTVLIGYHNVAGEVFRNLAKLQPGDRIILYTDREWSIYEAVTRRLLLESDQPDEVRHANARWIQPTDDDRITLVTSWPYTSNTYRLIIVAKPIGP